MREKYKIPLHSCRRQLRVAGGLHKTDGNRVGRWDGHTDFGRKRTGLTKREKDLGFAKMRILLVSFTWYTTQTQQTSYVSEYRSKQKL